MARRDDARRLEKRAALLMESADLERAAEAWLDAIRADASSVTAHVGLARCHEARGRLTLAIECWRSACELEPEHDEASLALAETLRQAGCYQEALDAYDRAAECADAPTFALAGKAETLRVLGHHDSALALFETVTELDPASAFALRGRAACLNARGDWEQALVAWDLALERDPESGFAQEGRRDAEDSLARGLTAGKGATTRPGRALEVTLRAVEWANALANDQRPEEALAVLRSAREEQPQTDLLDAELARILEDQGRWEEALRAHERRRQRTPDSGEAACDHADSLRRSGRYTAALLVYQEAIDRGSGLTGEAGRAEALRMLRRHDLALEGFERVLAVSPDMAFGLRGLAATLDALERHADALPLWTRAVELEPMDEFGHAGLAQCRLALGESSDITAESREDHERAVKLIVEGRPSEATALLLRLTAQAPLWAEAWHALGQAHLAERQYKQALETFERARSLAPDNLDITLDHADALRKHSDHRAAIEAYDGILRQGGETARALCGRAECLRMLGQLELALDWFDRALALDADHFQSLCGKAASLNALRRHVEAHPVWLAAARQHPQAPFVKRGLAQCKIAIAKAREEAVGRTVRRRRAGAAGPRDRARAQAQLEKGRSHYKSRAYAEAARCFSRALEIDPTFAEAALRLGMTLEDDTRYDDAVAAYERCLRIDTKNYQAATNIGEAYRKDEKYPAAIDAYDRALGLRPDYLYALAGRAECMRMLGDYQGSLTWFDKALGVGPRHAFAIQGKAAALNALSNFGAALPLWDRALEIEPDSAFARDGKAFCEAHLGRSGGGQESDSDVPDSATPTLDAQGRDLTALARAGELPLIVGREQEIHSVLKTLVRRLKANPLLLGEPGVGKTAVVEGVANVLASDDAPKRLANLRVIELSIGSLVAGTKYRGTFEERLREIIREASENPGIVLFIDEIHTLVGAGRTEGGSLDAANILKPALARGEITVIGATTLAEYRKHFEADSALDRRFQPVTIDEPSEAACVELLARVTPSYEKHHDVRVAPDALRACVRLAVRFVPERRLPDKALDLLDESCADASLAGQAIVDTETVARVVSERTGVPVHQLTQAERERLRGAEEELAQRVVGQSHAVARLAAAVRLARSGLRDPRRPRGVFLFVGASGVGKTELARALADYLFPEGDALIKLDMSEYSDRFTASRLLGAPPGYSGHGEEGQLTGPLRNRPYAVVLLDEFEKAHADVQSVFLSLFDEGRVTDSEGREVRAREVFFVLTTNAGAQGADRGRVGFGGDAPGELDKRVRERLKSQFRPELLNRMDDIVVFQPLDETALESVVALHLAKLEERAAEAGVRLSWDPAIVRHIATSSSDDAWGARPALRTLQSLVAEPLGKVIVEGGERLQAVRVEIRDGEVVLEEETPARGQNTASSGTSVGS